MEIEKNDNITIEGCEVYDCECGSSESVVLAGRFAHMDLKKSLSPALLAYNGIQYTYMALAVFEDGQYEYVQEVDKLGEDNSCLWK